MRWDDELLTPLSALHLLGSAKNWEEKERRRTFGIARNQEVAALQLRIYRWLGSLVKEVHRTQGRTLLAMVVAVCLTGKLRSLAIAQTLARQTRVLGKSALQRFYRFVNKSKLDPLAVWKELLTHVLVACRRVAVISIDWTEWRFDLRCLVATVALGRRAVPVFAQTFSRAPPRSQNCRENTFVRVLLSFSPSAPESGPGL